MSHRRVVRSATAVTTNGLTIVIDHEDREWVRAHRWYADVRARTTNVRRTSDGAPLARALLELHGHKLDGMQVDHRNHDGLDNRKANLRPCTPMENLRNRRGWGSSYKGVSHRPARPERWEAERWEARIAVAGKRLYLGSFATPEEAARAYNAAAVEHHGDFAHLNDVP